MLEGLDRSGKSTQVGSLEKRLRAEGREVRTMRFPGRFSRWFICLRCLVEREASVRETGVIDLMGHRA